MFVNLGRLQKETQKGSVDWVPKQTREKFFGWEQENCIPQFFFGPRTIREINDARKVRNQRVDVITFQFSFKELLAYLWSDVQVTERLQGNSEQHDVAPDSSKRGAGTQQRQGQWVTRVLQNWKCRLQPPAPLTRRDGGAGGKETFGREGSKKHRSPVSWVLLWVSRVHVH